MRNDTAFVVDMNLSIYEHQSTVNPNMPLRDLIYATLTLKDIIKGRNLYGEQLLKIPTPRFAVFYNGVAKQPEQYTLKLSDAYEHPVEHPELELICTVYNINRCIEENILRDFLIHRRTEVMKVMALDYTFDTRLMMERRDSREEGRAEGLAEGFSKWITIICKKLQKSQSIEEIAEDLEEEIEEIAPICMIAEEFAPGYDPQQVLERFLELETTEYKKSTRSQSD